MWIYVDWKISESEYHAGFQSVRCQSFSDTFSSLPRQIWHRNLSTDNFNNMTWTDYRKSLNISIYLTSFPKADLISLDPTSFFVPQGQQATEVKVMVAPEEAMYHGPGASARNNELGHT